MMKKKTEYLTLEQLRADKLKLQQSLGKQTKVLKRDAADVVLPSNNALLNSDFAYMRYIGYAITAYKTYSTLRKTLAFFTKFRKK